MRIVRTKKAKILAGCAAAAAVAAGMILASAAGASEVNAASQKIRIDAAHFPDPVFRSVIASTVHDKNQDGYIDPDEILTSRNIHCENMGVKSIKGVEYFTELRGLWINDNSISDMDISNNKEITGVWCSGNKFTSLDFSGNPELVWVFCFDCKITSINVSNNPKLAFLEINTNPLKTLDVTHNPELEHLTCGSCELTTLDLSNNPKLAHLDAFRNHFKKLDVTHNPKMKRLDVWDNKGLGSIDVSKCPGLQYYNCANNGATNIDVTRNPELTKLICSYNSISKLDLSGNPKLVYLDCAINNISKLDLSHNYYLYFLQAFTNPFKTLDIGYNPFLIKTYKEGVKRAEYDVCKGHSWTIDYGGDTSTGGDNIYFLCFDDAVKLSTKPKYKEPARTPGQMPAGASESDLMTREAVVQALYEMAGKPSVAGLKSRFTDVEPGSWYENALLWGEKYSICMGFPYVSSDTFGTDEYIERQDLIFMLMRFAEYMKYQRSIDFGRADDFIDYFDVDYYAWEPVTWAATWNIMQGKGDPDAPKEERRIAPHDYATRKEFQDMFNRMREVNGLKNAKLNIRKNSGKAALDLTFGKTSSSNIVCGNTMKLNAVLTGSSAAVTWTSSDPSVATVDSTGKVTAKAAGSVTITASAAGKTAKLTLQVQFKDVTNAKDFWYKPTYSLANTGVVKGYDKQTLFKPANKCTRAQMVTFIWRLMGEPAPKTKTCKFSDVKKTDYFYKACIWGNENKIVEGYKNGTFGPQIVCARRHAVTFLWRLAGQPKPSSSANKFSDVKKSDYFYTATLWASEKGILAGYSDGTFRPNGDCLRRQMVTFLYKYDKFVNNRG
ncbi:MAG: S-layer homology domain-containing protein [Clostridiales bacterium]|nr:S-layer homology domain-containing protein [Clostridiales bacterium]